MKISNCSAQTLSSYADQLYFGILSFKPNSAVTDFLTKYVPTFLKKSDTSNKWTAYPPDFLKEPVYYQVTHSFIFKTHPYVSGNFKSGQLAITKKIYQDKMWIDNITDIKLWFEFDSEARAKNLFSEIVDKFSYFQTLKRLSSEPGIEKAEFTDKNCKDYYGNIQIKLVTDYSLGTTKIKVTDEGVKNITEVGYKILVEIGNDLY